MRCFHLINLHITFLSLHLFLSFRQKWQGFFKSLSCVDLDCACFDRSWNYKTNNFWILLYPDKSMLRPNWFRWWDAWRINTTVKFHSDHTTLCQKISYVSTFIISLIARQKEYQFVINLVSSSVQQSFIHLFKSTFVKFGEPVFQLKSTCN